MDTLIAHFAGAKRGFRLRFGEVVDLEQACGKIGIGAIYQRLATTSYFMSDVFHILRLGLIGGGMPSIEAEELVRAQIEARPLVQLGALAQDVIIALMSGIEADGNGGSNDQAETHDIGKVFHAFVQMGISPDQVRAMQYADYVAILRAAAGKDVQPPTEDEFDAMISDWEERQNDN